MCFMLPSLLVANSLTHSLTHSFTLLILQDEIYILPILLTDRYNVGTLRMFSYT